MKLYSTPYSILLAAILTSTWPDGQVTKTAAYDMKSCEAAARLNLNPPRDPRTGKYLGLPLRYNPNNNQDLPEPLPAISASCAPATPQAAGFAPYWNCIKTHRGYTCD